MRKGGCRGIRCFISHQIIWMKRQSHITEWTCICRRCDRLIGRKRQLRICSCSRKWWLAGKGSMRKKVIMKSITIMPRKVPVWITHVLLSRVKRVVPHWLLYLRKRYWSQESRKTRIFKVRGIINIRRNSPSTSVRSRSLKNHPIPANAILPLKWWTKSWSTSPTMPMLPSRW